MVDTWHNRRGPFLQYMTRIFGYDILEWMLLEQTHADEQIYMFLLSALFLVTVFSQTESMLTFDLDFLEYMLSCIMKLYWF